jgi:acetyl esterase/lipase
MTTVVGVTKQEREELPEVVLVVWLTRDAMKWFWSNYLTDQTNVKDPTVSPLHASIEQLKGLPPALIINGENDVLRDEGEFHFSLVI